MTAATTASKAPNARIPVAILGATGAVGQRFVLGLADHPWFEPTLLVGDQSAGKRYRDAVRWLPTSPIPPSVAEREVVSLRDLERSGVRIVFSALPSGTAGPVEDRLVALGCKVFTNARDHRMDDGVPLLATEVNPDHLDLLGQRADPRAGWIVANGNCGAIVLILALAPLVRRFSIDEVHVTTLQALSGAGYPGVSGLDIVDNILPYIAGEEEKFHVEPHKTLGRLVRDPRSGKDQAKPGTRPAHARQARIEPLELPLHVTCTRANVLEGHTVLAHARMGKPVTVRQVTQAFASFRGPPDVQALPSAPPRPILVAAEPDRPQPRKDRDAAGGMAVTVGRIRVADGGRVLQFVAHGSNTVRGAAGQSILNAELAYARGML